jgi:hypothetical protein
MREFKLTNNEGNRSLLFGLIAGKAARAEVALLSTLFHGVNDG